MTFGEERRKDEGSLFESRDLHEMEFRVRGVIHHLKCSDEEV